MDKDTKLFLLLAGAVLSGLGLLWLTDGQLNIFGGEESQSELHRRAKKARNVN